MYLNFNIQIESSILKIKIKNNYDDVEGIRRSMRQCLRKNRETSIEKKLLCLRALKTLIVEKCFFLVYLNLSISLTMANHYIIY